MNKNHNDSVFRIVNTAMNILDRKKVENKSPEALQCPDNSGALEHKAAVINLDNSRPPLEQNALDNNTPGATASQATKRDEQCKEYIHLSDNSLLIDLLENERRSWEDVHQIISLLDNKTGNIIYRMAAKHFGFKVEYAEGKLVSTAKELGRALGHIDISNDPLTIAKYPIEMQERLRKTFGLSIYANSTRMLDWQNFMPAGLKKVHFGRYIISLLRYLKDASRNVSPSPSGQTDAPDKTISTEVASMKELIKIGSVEGNGSGTRICRW